MIRKIAIVSLALLISSAASARDEVGRYSVEDLLKTSDAKSVLNDVQLYFGNQKTPSVKEKFGEVMSNKKTNSFMKSDQEACHWVMLSALKALQERAQREGMNAVINIQSFYKKREFISDTEFECGAGSVMAGVTLKGTLVKI